MSNADRLDSCRSSIPVRLRQPRRLQVLPLLHSAVQSGRRGPLLPVQQLPEQDASAHNDATSAFYAHRNASRQGLT